MENRQTGPLLTDEIFFGECLDYNYGGMDDIRESSKQGDYREARRLMAAYIRESLEPERFFKIPYEVPENIFKFPGESDEDACRRICGHTLISVGVPMEYGQDKDVDWQANPTYNGYREWTWQLNRHNDIKLLAHEYNRTKDPILAKTAAELMQSWFRQALAPEPCMGYLTDCWRTIECGIRMGANWPYILYTFYRSEYFTDDLLVDWYKSVWEHGERLSRDHMMGNWLIMEMNGLAQIGILYPQLKKSKEWLAQALASLEEELDLQFYADGFQYELSTTYHNVVVNNYQRMIQVANAFDVPVPDGILKKLRTACELDIKLMMPDRRTPDINDGDWKDVEETCKIRERILPDVPGFSWLLGREGANPPEYTSAALEWSGFLVLRTGWTREDSWVFFDAAHYGRMHQHEDKLSVLFYANGKLLLTEGGNYAYDDSPMRRYVLSTRAHNTVLVDGQSQNRRESYTWSDEDIRKHSGLKWKLSDDWEYGEGSYSRGYGENAGIRAEHNRRIFWSRTHCREKSPLLIVVDRLKAEEAHRYSCLWHVDSSLTGEAAGEVSFKDLDVAYSAGEAKVICGQREPEWQGFIATGTKQGMYREVPCVSVEAEAKEIRIVTVFSAARRQEDRIRAVAAGSGLAEQDIRISFADGTVLVLDETKMM